METQKRPRTRADQVHPSTWGVRPGNCLDLGGLKVNALPPAGASTWPCEHGKKWGIAMNCAWPTVLEYSFPALQIILAMWKGKWNMKKG